MQIENDSSWEYYFLFKFRMLFEGIVTLDYALTTQFDCKCRNLVDLVVYGLYVCVCKFDV
jgi:hypothetical protein